MGTNFYWKNNPEELEEDSLEIHIGKRSAAGRYCWDCGCTLKKGGNEQVHQSSGKLHRVFPYADESDWYDACPMCGKKLEDVGFNSTGAVELGFAKSSDIPHVGVSSCSSFTWAQMEHKEKIDELAKNDDGSFVIVDEYGDEYTLTQFLDEELYNLGMEFELRREFS